MNNDFKLQYFSRPVVSWCSITFEFIPFKTIIRKHYWELAMKGDAEE